MSDSGSDLIGFIAAADNGSTEVGPQSKLPDSLLRGLIGFE